MKKLIVTSATVMSAAAILLGLAMACIGGVTLLGHAGGMAARALPAIFHAIETLAAVRHLPFVEAGLGAVVCLVGLAVAGGGIFVLLGTLLLKKLAKQAV